MAPVKIEAKGNAYEMAARFTKALKLAAAIDAASLAQHIDPHAEAEAIADGLANPLAPMWREVSISMGKEPPSEHTKAAVLAIFEARVLARKMVPFMSAANV